MIKDAEVNLMDLSYRTYKEFGVHCEVVPVQGHNYNGLAERKIKAVQDAFEKIEIQKNKLHATGLQTFCKLVENQLNNLPFGYSYGRDSNNSPMLKIITPNMLRMGRINSRAVTGPLKFPNGPADYLKKVMECYKAFYKIFDIAMVPKLIPQPKWFKDSVELKVA